MRHDDVLSVVDVARNNGAIADDSIDTDGSPAGNAALGHKNAPITDGTARDKNTVRDATATHLRAYERAGHQRL